MLLIYLASWMALVLAESDPTKVCLPDQIQAYMYTVETDATSLAVMDFTKKIIASFTGNASIVEDLANKTSYITDATGSCFSSPLLANSVFPQCLPATAVKLGDIYIGLDTSSLPLQTWQYPIDRGVLKVAFSNQPNELRHPVLTRYSDGHSITVSTFFFNVTTTITKPELLNIPDLCPPKVIV
ncbi:uncharacterized protein LOC129922665 [Biomphalaria glabrata]|uniref:Uncharacterized protein LOC129922665 n=1 Tax=Biomphalaria glabrata TaxID=6526 RepID=A0A9W2YRU5_BIOGL|nr:uncharacterized protein LOC129922665 [Biomphalaria glabrata]